MNNWDDLYVLYNICVLISYLLDIQSNNKIISGSYYAYILDNKDFSRVKTIDENCALSIKWGLLFPAKIQNNCFSPLTQFQTNNAIMEYFSIARQEEQNKGSHGDYVCFFSH